MGEIGRNADRPAICVPLESTAAEAARLMAHHDIGAVIVVDRGEMVGIFSERDLLKRVVAEGRDPRLTFVGAVMTAPVVAVPVDAPATETDVAGIMAERHIRHVPVVDRRNRAVGMLSMREVMKDRVEELVHEVQALEAWSRFDGSSG